MSEETVYINKCSIKQHDFDNGGSVLNISVHVDELIIHKNKEGWVSLSVCKRREPSDKGATHYMKLNDFTPEEQVEGQVEEKTTSSDDDLPF